MKICITARTSIDSGTGPQEMLNTQVDPRFGRCESFVIVDTETMEMKVMPNPSVQTAHGAGIQAAQVIVNQDVKVVITGKVGPNAHAALSTSNIKIITGAVGTIGQVIEQYRSGGLQEESKYPNVSTHFGQNMDMERKYGRGVGGGMRHVSPSFGSSYSNNSKKTPQSPSQDNRFEEAIYSKTKSIENLSPEDELSALEEDRKKLADDLEGIKARIKELKDLSGKNSETKD